MIPCLICGKHLHELLSSLANSLSYILHRLRNWLNINISWTPIIVFITQVAQRGGLGMVDMNSYHRFVNYVFKISATNGGKSS